MATYTLTALDTVGIQKYLFSTNNLRQNAGSSYLVELATRQWVQEALPEPHNVNNLDDLASPINLKRTIEDDQLAAELIYAGGGNAVILFADREKAHRFTQHLTKRVMLEAPGLQLVITHQDGFDWEKCSLGGPDGWINKVMVALDQEKARQSAAMPTLGLGITATCVFTGLPAVAYDKDNRPVSSEAEAKELYETFARDRLRRLIDLGEYDLPFDFDYLGGTHDESRYVAVIHADSNGMGKRILKIRNDHVGPKAKNRDYINHMRAFSLSAQQESLSALKAMVAFLKANIKTKIRKGKLVYHIQDQLELWKNGQQPLLPIRPLISGGDDLTFVCDGRLALPLAAYYLQNLSNRTLSDGEKIYCRAGIAVVHTHYPFARAYNLAEALCKTAKKAIQRKPNGIGTAMDWHFAVSGPIRTLEEIRRREHTSDSALGDDERAGDLLMRPVYIHSRDSVNGYLRDEWRTWQNLRNTIVDFQEKPEWTERRNKVIALREALRQGGNAVDLFRLGYRIKALPELQNTDLHMQETGWYTDRDGARCGYFDAIEATDFFLKLDDPEEK